MTWPNRPQQPPDASPSRRQSIQMQRLPNQSEEGGERFGASVRPSLTRAQEAANLPGLASPYWERPEDVGPTPVEGAARRRQRASVVPQIMGIDPLDCEEDDDHGDADSDESDRAPLKVGAQPPGRLETGEMGRYSFQGGDARPRMRDRSLGQDVEAAERRHSYGATLAPEDRRRSRSPSTGSSALSRAGSMVRAMSQRVVMISGEDLVDAHRRSRSQSRSDAGDVPPVPVLADTYHASPLPLEKKGGTEYVYPTQAPPPLSSSPSFCNPLRGKSFGVFGPDNVLRRVLCDVLVQPWTEFVILLLIVAQAVLLAAESAYDVFSHPRPPWGTPFDHSFLFLFLVFTLEVVAKMVVSGFVINAEEYADHREKRQVRERVAEQYRAVFKPQRQRSERGPRHDPYAPATFARFGHQASSLEEQQRLHLARRAFLRHSFNRVDFVAVVAYWISFFLVVAGAEGGRHVYMFRMLSCLRIIRLLALTKGNLIILRSLKKAAPLLVRVSFLVGFFWLVFAVIGVQSFKSSLSRQCTWLNPDSPSDPTASYSPPMRFCGGYLDATTGETKGWVRAPDPNNLSVLDAGSSRGKGFICPRGSICLQQGNPYNNTVHFDDIAHSVELVFVIMSANTFSDLMYYTMSSDYLPAALFFAAAIVIMMLWMTNLLIAVITSSFQVIREESQSSAFRAEETPAEPPVELVPRRRSVVQKVYDKVSWVFILVVAFGIVAQTLRRADMSAGRARLIDLSETAVTAVLAAEISVRVLADARGFWTQPRNLVDLGLAVITCILLVPPVHASPAYAWLSVFQILRIYRVVMAIPMTRTLISLVLGNVTGIVNLMVFVFLMTFLMAIFASQLFRGELPVLDSNGNNIRIPFNNIYNSFLGMYQVLSSENWTDVLYRVTAYTTQRHTAWLGALFLMGWFFMSYFVLINMFIAVIQENFDVGEDVKRVEQVKAFLQRKELGGSSTLALSKVFTFGKGRRARDPLDYGPATMEMLLKEAVVREFLDDAMEMRPAPTSSPQAKPGVVSSMWAGLRTLASQHANPFHTVPTAKYDATMDPRTLAREAVRATANRRQAQRDYLAQHPWYNVSLYMFGPRHPVRTMCQRLVGPGHGSERFEGLPPNRVAWFVFSAFIYAAVVCMVVIASVTTPRYQREYLAAHGHSLLNWYVWTDLAFALLFTLESLVKVVADGFFWTPNAYFRSTWGVIDGVVLVTLWINVLTLITNNGAVSRAVGAFKALRALRLLNVSDSARDTFHTLMVRSAWKILSAASVSVALLIPFAIYGLNLFNGSMVACNDTSGNVTALVDCHGEWLSTPYSNNWTMLAPRAAANPYYHFDDFAASIFILFQIVSQEGWVDVSFSAQQITGPGLQPIFGQSPGNALFFVVFNLMATVFVLTLFISVFMRNYTEQTGVAYLTAEQRSWLELRKLLRQISPSKSRYDEARSRWEKWCHKRAIEKRGPWYLAITGVLVVHLVLLLSEFYAEPAWWTRTRDVLFLLFTLVYTANVAVRMVGLGWHRFRRSTWDLYSLAAVVGALITSVLFLSDTVADTFIQLHKFFLVALIFLLIPRNDALDQLFKTAAASLTTIGNLLATWFVFFLVFAIALTQSFSLTRFGANETSNLNLRTVPHALILLFRMSCGEGWNQIMEDFAQMQPPLCVENPSFFDSDCGSPAWARVLFVAWNITSMYIFVNLFVSLIYESFSYVYQRTNGLAVVDRDEIRRFKEAWRSADPAGTGFISKDAFPRLLGELSGVFEMRIYDNEHSVHRILEDVQAVPADACSSNRHHSMPSGQLGGVLGTGIDLAKLNARLARIPAAHVRARRRRFDVFFEEVMVSADPDRGISFTTVLLILAHYNIISDAKSLRLEEFLRRRARLQRVEEEVRRRVVLGFFDMLYYSRRFRRHVERRRAARMTAVPTFAGVPEILVENDDDDDDDDDDHHHQHGAQQTSETYLSANRPVLQRSWSGGSADIAAPADARTTSRAPVDRTHPLAGPRAARDARVSQSLSAARFDMPGTTARGMQLTIDTDVPRASSSSSVAAGGGSPGGVSPAQVREMLDDSAWMASLRRSATLRRTQSDWGK